MQDQVLHGASLNCADYDLRSPLHLAAAENQVAVLEFLVEQNRLGNQPVDLNPRDRWGGTPLDDAQRHGHWKALEILEDAGGRSGMANIPDVSLVSVIPPTQGDHRAGSEKFAELIWAASEGDLTAIYRLVAQGVPLEIADYDLRTPLHLAAAEGHRIVVEYFIAQSVGLNPQDRWGNTPFDDALRHGHEDVRALLGAEGGIPGFVLIL